MPEILRQCSKCKNTFPATTLSFRPIKRGSEKLRSVCRECERAYLRSPKAKESQRAYANSQKGKATQNARMNSPKRKESAQRRQSKPESKAKSKESAQRWRSKPESKAKSKEWRQSPEGKALVRAYQQTLEYKTYRKNFRQSPRGRAADKIVGARRAARKRALPADFTAADWNAALDYFNYRCAVCGRPEGLWHALAADHWIPVSDSLRCPGTVPTNILPLCHGLDGCNNSKNNRDPIEWLFGKLGKRAAKEKLEEVEAYFKWAQDRRNSDSE